MAYKKITGAEFDISSRPPPFSTSIEGLESTGKTHISLLTTPPPVVHVNFGDRDATWFLYQMDEERRKQTTMYSFSAKTSDGWTRPEGMESLQELSKIAQDHLSDNKMVGGTFIIDSGSSWWEVVQECFVAPEQEKRQAEGGKKTGGLEYMQGNLIVNGVASWVKNQGAFVIFTHRKTQEWGPAGPIPGKFRAQINRKIPFLVEVRLDLRLACVVCGGEECEAKGHQGRKQIGRFLKFGASLDMIGYSWENPDFRTVYALYTGQEAYW